MPEGTRPRRRRDRRRPRAASPRTAPTQRDARAVPTTGPRTPVSPAPQEKEPDYRYVYRDLKHFAIIGGGIVLAFLILRIFWN